MPMVKFEDGRLLISNDQVQWVPLFAETQTRFFVEDEGYRFVFVKDNDGKVTHMNIEVEGVEIMGKKVK